LAHLSKNQAVLKGGGRLAAVQGQQNQRQSHIVHCGKSKSALRAEGLDRIGNQHEEVVIDQSAIFEDEGLQRLERHMKQL
jgi:hypothetical protein